MIHFATVHYLSPMWIDIQLREIARHTSEEYRVWACLNGIDPSYGSRFHYSADLEGGHGEKLNALAETITGQAQPDDLIAFIDGDAFPIDGWVGPVRELLASAPLVAVRRDENLGDIQPHPCFAVTTVGFWNEIGGDWAWGGAKWINAIGIERQDAGGRVLARLEELDLPWHPLLRSNKKDLHRILFGVYGDIVYHHGAGFRGGSSIIDRLEAGVIRRTTPTPGIRGFIAKRRLKRRLKNNREMSDFVFEHIRDDEDFVKRYFLTAADDAATADYPHGV